MFLVNFGNFKDIFVTFSFIIETGKYKVVIKSQKYVFFDDFYNKLLFLAIYKEQCQKISLKNRVF